MATFPIDSEVRARNGLIGYLSQVVLDSYSGEVSDLVVRLRGGEQSIVIPRSRVLDWDEGGIDVDMLVEDLEKERLYSEADFQQCQPGDSGVMEGQALAWQCRYGSAVQGVAAIAARLPDTLAPDMTEEEAAVGRDTPVYAVDEPVGRLDHVLVDYETGGLTYLILRRSRASGRAVVIPVEMVERVDEAGVHLKGKKEELAGLTSYTPRSDEVIRAEVRECLIEVGCDLDEVEYSVERGVVTLRGPVRDVASKRQIDQRVRAIEGVVAVENALTADSALAAEVVAALARDARTNLSPIGASAEHGIITLEGQVDSEEEKEAAGAIARQVPGVVLVINDIEVVPGVEKRPTGIFVLHPQQWRQFGM